MPQRPDDFRITLDTPLYKIVGTLAALWTLANLGYYLVLPHVGVLPDYNHSPTVISLYFLAWTFISVRYFWSHFRRWVTAEHQLWRYGALSLCFALIIGWLIYVFALLPELSGPTLTEYSNILFATPAYFLPKAADILLQQVLITTLILALYYRLKTYKAVLIGYSICFGGAHVILFFLNSAATVYAATMTLGALFSTFVFPYFILKVRDGFVYNYAIHFLFYVLLAIGLHLWPPPGYVSLAPQPLPAQVQI